MVEHTPGPWRVRYPSNPLCDLKLIGSDGESVASTHPPEHGSWKEEANARLIALAPEMLEALRLLVACEGPHGALDVAMVREYLAAARAILDKLEAE